MKKTIIISITIALIAGGCGQAKKKQAEIVNNEPAVEKEENNTIINEDKETVLHLIEQNEEWSAEAENTYGGYELGDALIGGGGELWYKVEDKNNLTTKDSIYTSTIRPGERLLVGDFYTDHFDFFDYNDEGDDLTINVLKDGKMYNLVANDLWDIIASNTQFKQGDLLKIQWTIDFLIPAGDESIYYVVIFAKKITKINRE